MQCNIYQGNHPCHSSSSSSSSLSSSGRCSIIMCSEREKQETSFWKGFSFSSEWPIRCWDISIVKVKYDLKISTGSSSLLEAVFQHLSSYWATLSLDNTLLLKTENWKLSDRSPQNIWIQEDCTAQTTLHHHAGGVKESEHNPDDGGPHLLHLDHAHAPRWVQPVGQLLLHRHLLGLLVDLRRQLCHLHRHDEELQDGLPGLPQGRGSPSWSNKSSLWPKACPSTP